MAHRSRPGTAARFLALVALVVGLSALSTRLWGGKAGESPAPAELTVDGGMTLAQFGRANHLPDAVVRESFGVAGASDLQRKVEEFGTPAEVESRVREKLALAAEHAGKNWLKILVKFALWFAFLPAVFFRFRERALTPGARMGLLLAAVALFGVVMGSDPSPMGTVKDAIHLYATAHAVFPPRLIALAVFLAIVVLANKYICAWGCQAGTLQDLLFRINRDGRGRGILGRQTKLPFVLTNGIRSTFLLGFTVVSVGWGFDTIEPIDPFKVYNPLHLGLMGGVFVGGLLLASLFVYRPWCHLFCPFGLVGWVAEKASRVRISVDYATCIACEKCARECPSTVMGAILKRDRRTIPDCFACYTCRDTCPTGSIRFSTRGRTQPPPGHFTSRGRAAVGAGGLTAHQSRDQ